MLHRIRLGMQSKDGGKLSGEVEVDETLDTRIPAGTARIFSPQASEAGFENVAGAAGG
ncbi:MAG TPA: hypothetical protein VLM42_20535 [Bryobacteraceae bacterium]|nr:hypothetical protein [Bryobacteraceae bacterium]